MPKYRLQRIITATQGGMSGGEIQERVIELPAGMSPPPGAEAVADSVAVTEWAPQAVEVPEGNEE